MLMKANLNQSFSDAPKTHFFTDYLFILQAYGKFNNFWAKSGLLNASVVLIILLDINERQAVKCQQQMRRGGHLQLQDTYRNETPAAWTTSIGSNLVKKKVKEALENRFWLYQTEYSWLWLLVSALCQVTMFFPRQVFPSNLLQALLIQVFSLAFIWVDTQCSMSVTRYMCPPSWSQHDKTLKDS